MLDLFHDPIPGSTSGRCLCGLRQMIFLPVLMLVQMIRVQLLPFQPLPSSILSTRTLVSPPETLAMYVSPITTCESFIVVLLQDGFDPGCFVVVVR